MGAAIHNQQILDIVTLLELIYHGRLGIGAHARSAEFVNRPTLRQHFIRGGNGQGLTLNVWDRTLQQRVMALRGHRDVPDLAAFSPDGRTLASCGVDGQLKLWHLSTRREVVTLLGADSGVRFEYLAFSPDGTWLGGTDTKGLLHLFHGPVPSNTESASNP